jgi:SP family galactose:H+ symporter-like MFS transporter
MEKHPNAYQASYVYFIGLIAGLAGLLFGFDTGIISGAITFIQKEFELSNAMEGLIVSIVMIGAILGTVVSNFISRNFGRRDALVAAGALFTVCAIGSALATHTIFLITVRFFLGIAIGLASYTAPLYLAEISPRQVRGMIIAFYQLMIAAGLLASYISDLIFTPSGSWRWMLGIPAIPGIFLLLFSLKLPGSPRWLMLKNRPEETRRVLKRIFPPDQAEKEFNEIRTRVEVDRSTKPGWHALFDKKFVSVLILGIGAQMMQQWTGCNIILYYAPIIFKLAGFATPIQQMWGTIAVGTVMMVTTIIAVKYVDKWGRRPILFWGLAMMMFSLTVLGIATHFAAVSSAAQAISVAFVLIYIFGFAISLGPIVWIICSEIFPIYSRDFGIMCTTAGNWIFNAMLASIFPSMISWLGSNAFFLFVGACILSFLFVYFFIPETKGVSLEQIETNLKAGKKLRHIGK